MAGRCQRSTSTGSLVSTMFENSEMSCTRRVQPLRLITFKIRSEMFCAFVHSKCGVGFVTREACTS